MDVTTTATAAHDSLYPETDGKPMAETDVHINTLLYLREALKDYFREASQVYVAGNLFLQSGRYGMWLPHAGGVTSAASG